MTPSSWLPPSWLAPIFATALHVAQTTSHASTLAVDVCNTLVFLHVSFHPHDAAACWIQRAFWSTMLAPPGISALHFLTNQFGAPLNISQLIVMYHWPCNLGNLLLPWCFWTPSGIATPNFHTQIDGLDMHHLLPLTHSWHIQQCLNPNPNPNPAQTLQWCHNPTSKFSWLHHL
jgi:hypothetical protein